MRNPILNNHTDRADLGEKKLEGRYANYFKVGYNALEFIFDFGQHYSGIEEAELYTRIVTSPCYAKSLFAILRESIEQYEKTFGDIKKV